MKLFVSFEKPLRFVAKLCPYGTFKVVPNG